MKKLQTDWTPDECANVLRAAIRRERGKREPVRGWVLGRMFRLTISQYDPHASAGESSWGVVWVIYGRMSPDKSGSRIRAWEFSPVQDPLWMLLTLLFFTWTIASRPNRVTLIALLLFCAVGELGISLTYHWNKEKYDSLVRELRWFLRNTLNAQVLE